MSTNDWIRGQAGRTVISATPAPAVSNTNAGNGSGYAPADRNMNDWIRRSAGKHDTRTL